MKITYRPEIDGLRAIAVVSVILYHYHINFLNFQLFRGGFIGVDLFFVISGYLISSIILKELLITESFSFKYFYERRIRRIVPILILVILASLPFAWLLLFPSDLRDFSKSVLSSIGFSSNFYFHYSGQVYGNQIGTLKPFLHTWSLSIEEQFYILFPLIFLISFRYSRKYLFYILLLGFLVSLGLADWGSKNHSSFTFYFLITRIWELLAGSILAYLEIFFGSKKKEKKFDFIFTTIGLGLIIYSIIFFHDQMRHPSFLTFIPVLGVCLIIWFSNHDEIVTKIISTKPFVFVGLISYSLYLWHYPFFAFGNYYRQNWINLSELFFFKYKLDIIIIIILSIISYFFVEKPFRQKKYSFKKIISLITVFLIPITIFNFYIISISSESKHEFLTKYDDEHKIFLKNYNYDNFNYRKNIFIVGNSYSQDLLNLFSYDNDLNEKYYFYTPIIDTIEVDSPYQISCFVKFLSENNLECKNYKFSRLNKQYENADYFIFHQEENSFFLTTDFDEMIFHLKKLNKNFLIILNNIHDANILDKYILKNNSIPNLSDLIDLEKKLFYYSLSWDKKTLETVKEKFDEQNINYILRSDILCDILSKTCPLIKNDNKIYSDHGHLTENGAKYFSKKASEILKNLINY